MLEHTSITFSSFGGGHDRAEIIGSREHALLVVADGAGGMSGASRAADLVVEIAREIMRRPRERIGSRGLSALLEHMDHLILRCRQAGESTAVLVELVGDAIYGASVGDSGAWLVHGRERLDLTAQQHRKWRLGSGLARPVPFGPFPLVGTLLVASDGLLECAEPDRLTEAVRSVPLADVAGSLVERVRLPDGALRDDVALVLARLAA